MNFLLRKLKADGTMVHDCIAFANESQAEKILVSAPGRAILHMGEGTHPGPFWAVQPEDAEALVAAGYRLIRAAQ